MSNMWEGDLKTFEHYISTKTEADLEGIWIISDFYKVGVIRDGDTHTAFIIESSYDDWLPKMIKFKVETIDGSVKVTWYLRDHSTVIDEILVQLGSNHFIVGSSLLTRVNSKFPDNFIDFSGDAHDVVQTIENVHPIFIIDGFLPSDYEDRKNRYLQTTGEHITLKEFILAMQRYIAGLKDGHMDMFLKNEAILSGKYLDKSLSYDDNKIYLTENTKIQVTHIGGVAIPKILSTIEEYIFFENESAKIRHYPYYIQNMLMLSLAGVVTDEDKPIILSLTENGQIKEITSEITQNWQGYETKQQDYIIRHEMIDDEIFYISLTTFVDGDHITAMTEEIKKAVENGIWRFIIDVRGNGGGNSTAGTRLLEAMGMTLPSFGVIRKMSELARSQRPDHNFPADIDKVEEKNNTKSENPNNIYVSVLTDRASFSSSTMLGAIVQDGKLGNIIGEPSSNAPNSFGDIIDYTLPKTKLSLSISYSWWERPDTNADPNTLMPDINVPSKKALETATEFLKRLKNNQK